MITPYHAKYFAYELTKRCSSDSIQKFALSLSDAQVDLNPHQVEAALFAFRSPLSKGAVLADEVGLGKTIEAGIVISQKWAERKRNILIIVPANLRKQWYQELLDKFFLSSFILEAKIFNEEIKRGNLNPFVQNGIIICSYHFARQKDSYIRAVKWDLVVIDEAHRLRNVYKPTNKIANAIKNAVANYPKILLTATPLQNSLIELYGLVSIIDEHAFGDLRSFKSQFARLTTDDSFDELKQRLKPICIRTLRRQVLEYIKYTNRIPITQEFFPSEEEQRLYDLVSDYLQRPSLHALPSSQRQLMTLILRKLLASSTYAISGTLEALATKLESTLDPQQLQGELEEEIEENFEAYGEIADEWLEEEEEEQNQTQIITPERREEIQSEVADLKDFGNLAKSIKKNSKGEVLLTALKTGFAETEKRGGNKKVVIFTESRRTQLYLYEILENTELAGKIVLFNGSNNDQKSKDIYRSWLDRHSGTNRITGSKTADTRAAIIDYFREEAVAMIATEAAAEGINLQFCSQVVNYDLPWNPQRIEQRIGRCHRYGQKNDVVVVNFLNRNNAADQRVYELLAEKFRLFDGVFGASDEVLGVIESGVDFERRIAEIYQSCRTYEEIQASFHALQAELEGEITENLKTTRQKLLENFDEEVHEKLRVNLTASREYLSKYEEWLWEITHFSLSQFADFSGGDHSFLLKKNPFAADESPPGEYRLGKNIDDAFIYRINHSLARRVIDECKSVTLEDRELVFDYTNTPKKISIVEELVGKSGWLSAVDLTISSFDTEDHIIMSGVCDDGTIIDSEQCQRLFSLSAQERQQPIQCDDSILGILRDEREREKNLIVEDIGARNGSYFEMELDKLDRWAEDRRNSLKVALKDLDDQIKELKREARLAPNLPEKLKLEKEKRDLEKKRDEAWREYDGAAREIEKNKDVLIDEIEKRLNQQIEQQELFKIRWTIT